MELREWQYMNKPAGSTTNNSSSTGYKKRFEKLIKYHIDHASSELVRVNSKVINDYDFRLSEYYDTGTQEFNRIIIVSVAKYSKIFFLNIFVDGKEVYHNNYNSYEEILEILTDTYMFLPDKGTTDYSDLLTESLNEWKPMNTPKPAQANNTFDNTYRYQRLLAQIDSDGIATYKVNKLDNVELDITVDTANQKGLHLNIFDNVPDNPNAEDYSFTVDNKASGGWKYDEEILPMLIAGRVMQNDDLCESAGSIADDFKLYENLWN